MGDTKILASKPKYHHSNPFSGTPVSVGASVTQERFQEAVVVDVVTNDGHSEYQSDGYNVGCIKFRAFKSQSTRDKEALNWAFPLDANMEEFPLKNEIVLVFQSLNKMYYMPKMSIGNSPSNQAFLGLENEMGPAPSVAVKVNNRQSSKANPIKQPNQNTDKLGNYFVEKPHIHHLRHWEGDKIIEGRSGHSIRFGTCWKSPDIHLGLFQSLEADQSPNILIRVGPATTQLPVPDTIYGRVVEDINEDKSSLWLVSDQVVKIKLATEGTSYNGRSITNFPNPFSGNQIILNSGRVIINSKSDKVLVHAFDGIHLSTLKDGTWDAEQDFIVRTGRRVSLISPKIHVGSASDTADRMMLGDTFIEALKLLVQAHITNEVTYVITPVGPGTLSPAVTAAWKTLQQKMDTFLSQDNYVSRTNQR